jgi:hypothetical protein
MSPLLAQSGYANDAEQCPLIAIKPPASHLESHGGNYGVVELSGNALAGRRTPLIERGSNESASTTSRLNLHYEHRAASR